MILNLWAEKDGSRMMSKDKKKMTAVQIGNLVVSVLVFLFMLYLNLSVRYCTDDWHYEFVYYGFMPDAGVRKMRTFQDLLISILNYYRINGGRILANGSLFFVLMADQWVFDVVNSGMFVLMGLLVYRLVPDSGWRTHVFSLPLIYFSILYFSLSFGDSAVWLSGSVNYLWMGVLNLFTVYLFRKYAEKQRCGFPEIFVTACLMFLAGQSNETTGGMLLILIVLYGLAYRRERKIDWRLYAAAVPSILCGMAVVILAPGNRNRAREVHNIETIGLKEIRHSVSTYLTDLLGQTWPVLLICLFVFLIQMRRGKRLQAFCAQRFFWAGVAGTAALGLAGVMIPRGTFLPVAYLILAGCENVEFLFKKWTEIKEKGCLEKLQEKSRLSWTALRLIAALFCLETVYLLSVLLEEDAVFSGNDLLFLSRGIGFMALAAVVLILPNKQFWMGKILRYGKKILVLGVLIFGIFYFTENMRAFQINKAMQRTMEEQARKAATAGEGEVAAVGFPLFQISDFWPRESGCSHEYTAAWMREYFLYEEGEM